jgi:3-polyprenyl-4-hydroxybenzoate decarboxylase
MTKKATLEAGGVTTKRVVVGITGASGAVYGLTALKALRVCPERSCGIA